MLEEKRHLDLVVPTGWNQCTTEQLELIAQVLLRHTAMQDRYHPYDALRFKTECFLALSGVKVLRQYAPEGGDADAGSVTFVCRRRKEKPFEMQVWQVQSFVSQHLGWLDDFTGLWIFPYPTFGHYWRWDMRFPFAHREPLDGPAPLLDGMSWRQYHFASDWLDAYAQDESTVARHGFLKALFGIVDLSRTPRRLRRMRPDQFQLCLIWWQSMMKEMQQKYRRCFKSSGGKPSRRKPSSPIDLYTRSTATLQDKYHLTEDEINLQPCRVILQHLDDMVRESEELERISKNSRRKNK